MLLDIARYHSSLLGFLSPVDPDYLKQIVLVWWLKMAGSSWLYNKVRETIQRGGRKDVPTAI